MSARTAHNNTPVVNPVLVNTRDVTPEYLSRLLSSLGEGERLSIGLAPDGRVEIFATYRGLKGRNVRVNFRNYIFTNPHPEPTIPGWLSNRPIDEGFKNWKPSRERRKLDRTNFKRKEYLKVGFALEIASRGEAGATKVKRDSGEYLLFRIAHFEVYTSLSLSPLFFRDSERSDMEYFS